MTAEDRSILSQKIARVKFDIAVYPRLAGLANAFARGAAEIISDLTQTEVDVAIADSKMLTLENTAKTVPEGAPLFWLSGDSEEDGALLEVAPSFLTATAECLLGGQFAKPEGDAAPASLDMELARLFIDRLAGAFSDYLCAIVDDDAPAEMMLSDVGTEFDDVLTGRAASAFIAVTLEGVLEGGERFPAVTYHLPMEFLEKRNLLEATDIETVSPAENTKWREVMHVNVDSTEIDLAVVLGTFKTTLSEFNAAQIDDVIPLEENNRMVDLVLKTEDGDTTVGKGLLGTYKKVKAVKLLDRLSVPPPAVATEEEAA